jgi:hypothetical protein
LLRDGRRSEPRFGYLFPPDHSFPVLVHDRLNALDKARVLLVRQHFDLVSTHMKVRARRDRGNFPHYVVDECVGLFVVDAERTPADFRFCVERGRARAAAQSGKRGQGSVGVTRHVDLRDDRDVSLPGVAHNLLIILLGVEPARSATDLRLTAD